MSRYLRRSTKKDACNPKAKYTALKEKKYDKRRELNSLGRVTVNAIYPPRSELTK